MVVIMKYTVNLTNSAEHLISLKLDYLVEEKDYWLNFFKKMS
jgi:hypothetical protein